MNYEIPEKMKAWVLGDPGELTLEEKPVPEPKRAEVLIHVDAVAICATDLEIIKNGPPALIQGGLPFNKGFTPGHEYMGTIVKLGPGVDEYKVGDRVAVEIHAGCDSCERCREGMYTSCLNYGQNYEGHDKGHRANGFTTDGGFAEYCLLPSKWQLIVAKNASMEELAMTEPACVAQHAVRRADVQAGQYVVIFGAGPIGIMAARWVKLFGATPLLVDIAQDKVEFAIEKGLDAINSRTTNVSEEIRNRNHGKLADAAIEGTGAGVVLSSCVECIRAKGTISLLGNPSGDATLPLAIHSQMLRKELAIHGVWNSSRAPFPVNEWMYTVQMLDEGKFQVKDLITGRYSLDELPGVIDEIHNGKHHEVKTMCTCMPKE